MKVLLGPCAVGLALCAACGDSEGDVSEKKSETGGRGPVATSGGAPSPSGGSPSPSGGAATGGASGGQSPATFGGFESTGGRRASGGSGGDDEVTGGAAPIETAGAGGESPGECGPLSVPKGAVHDGDFEIASAEDAEAASQLSEITGTLTISVPEVELNDLTHIGGNLASTGAISIRLPALTQVGGSIYYYLDDTLELLDLRNLRRTGQLYVHRNSALEELQIDSLIEAPEFEISANLKLADCYLDVVDTRFQVLHTAAPDCTCSRSCNFVVADCP